MPASKRRRAQKQKVVLGAPENVEDAPVKEPAKPQGNKPQQAKTSGGGDAKKPVKRPWSRKNLAILFGSAFILCALAGAFLVAPSTNTSSLDGLFFGDGQPIALGAAFVALETPVRLWRKERRMTLLEAIITGMLLATALNTIGGVTLNINAPSVTTTTTASGTTPAPSATSPSPRVSDTAAPSATPCPSNGDHGSAVPTPCAGSSGTSVSAPPESENDKRIALAGGDVVGFILLILIYPPAYKFMANPQSRNSPPSRRGAPPAKGAKPAR